MFGEVVLLLRDLEGQFQSQKNQLSAFVNFIHSDSVLLRAIRDKDWLYYDVTCKVNGGYNGYDDRRIRFNKVAKLLGINKG
ncbi:N-acetylmuramidase domain-containing protein [Serratia rhizosphaerae]|uniref:N-acetylmuramidase domain-containing protein n=1 Tax=Serratia rhizosphaerae TaxID=2597702 RepID=UPI002DB7EFB6|nr:N-acetylmuramidase domain-containing protein [Serratia rhizosphaerae]MEB6335713.1 N-acetylmuramidase domain-containing protein [Serratia rhizosphaerae]